MFAIKTDSELEKLFKKCILPGSGVIPSINPVLVDSKTLDLPSQPVSAQKKKPKTPKKSKVKNNIFPANNVFAFDDKDETKITSKNVTILNERILATGQKVFLLKNNINSYNLNISKLKVIQADITNVVADAIVHPTNNSFYMGGEVGSAIARAGGDEVKSIVNDLYKSYNNLGICSGKNQI